MSEQNTTQNPVRRIPRNLSKREQADAMNRNLASLAKGHNDLVQYVQRMANVMEAMSAKLEKLQRTIEGTDGNGDIEEE